MYWILISYPAFKPSYEPSVNRRQISGEEKANECREQPVLMKLQHLCRVMKHQHVLTCVDIF